MFDDLEQKEAQGELRRERAASDSMTEWWPTSTLPGAG
jgi:hypothetical protein